MVVYFSNIATTYSRSNHVPQVYAEVLPADKASKVKLLQVKRLALL